MLKFRNLFLVFMGLVITSSRASAVQIPQSMKDNMSVATAGMPSLLNLLVSMVVVIAMIYITGIIYSKLNVINRSKLNCLTKEDKDKHRFTVLQSLPLGQQRHIYSIEMDGKIFLVGSTPNQISLIKEFDPENSGKDIKNEAQIFDNNKSDDNEKIDIDELYKKYKK